MKLRYPGVILAMACVAIAGCAKKQVSSIDRMKAANLVSEAQFAVTVREYARAAGLYVQATKLCPDAPGYWVELGATRMRMSRRGDARRAYQRALHAFADAASADKANPDPVLQQVYVLALLGKVEDARALFDKLPTRFPNDAKVRQFVAAKQLDHMLADPSFKEIAL